MAKKKESKEEVKNKKESQVTTEKKKGNKKVDSSVKTEVIDTKKNKELEKKLKQERKKINNVSVTDSDIWSKVIIVCVIICVFFAFYFLTVFISKDDSSSTNSNSSNKKTTETTNISYDEILLGRSFSMEDGEYLVLYYDKDNSDLSSEMSSALSTYNNKDSHLNVYTVDMSDALNSSFTSDKANHDAKDASEMKISGPTLIKFNNNKIDDYIEGKEKITDYLK